MSRSSFHSSRPVRSLTVALVLGVAGCGASEEPLEASPAELLLGGDTVASYAVEDASGAAPLSTWVRALNAYGASIAAEPSTVTVAGMPLEVQFDGTGYARVVIPSPGAITVSTPTDEATLHAFASTWPGFGANRASVAPVIDGERAVEVSTGVVVAKGTELWWAGSQGGTHRVLNADGPLVGLRAVNVDVDDVLDVIAWTDYSVFLLRGRGDGGLSWGGGFTAPNFTVGGADVGDLNSDNLPDVAIAWASTDVSKLDVWNGDGLFAFSAAEPRNLPELPIDVSIGDNTDEGKNQLTVIDASGSWTRYIAGNELQYMPIGPSMPTDVLIQLDSSLDAAGDINADRAEELWIYGPRTPGVARSVYLVDLKGQHIEYVPYNPVAAYLTRADGDGNEVLDLFAAHEDNTLHSLSYDLTSTGTYRPRRLETLPEHGAIGLHDWYEDDLMVDLFLAGDALWWWWRGANDPMDFDTFWSIREPTLDHVGTSVEQLGLADLDGASTTAELITFEVDGGETSLVIHQSTPGAGSLVRRGDVVLTKKGTAPLDLAVCNGFAWVVLSGELVRVNLANLDAPLVTGTLQTLGSRVDCGAAPDGAVAALLSDGAVELLNASLGVVATLTTTGAQDLAIGDVGAGPEVVTCGASQCTIAWWPWGSSGEASFVTASGGQISYGAGVSLPGAGEMSLHDVDADGNLDLLAASAEGVVTLLRSSGSAIAHPEYYHFRSGISGAVHAADADGDGHGDLWLVDGAGDLHHTIAPWVPLVTEPGDTGDTGASTDTGAP